MKIRVITGTAKGRRLSVPLGSRPIGDRAKSSLFSVIGTDILGTKVLDLYAGSGSLGIESLSRGASHCTFVDSDRHAVECIERNLASTNLLDKATIARQKTLQYLENQTSDLFDIVFADPPYEFYKKNMHRILNLIDHIFYILPPKGAIILKHPKSITFPDIPGLILADQRTFANTTVTIWVKTRSEETP